MHLVLKLPLFFITQVVMESSSFFKSWQQVGAFRLAAAAAQRTAEISTVQYEGGEVPSNTVITTLQANFVFKNPFGDQ